MELNMDTGATARLVTLTEFRISQALAIPKANVEVRVDYLIDEMTSEMVANIRGFTDELPENREDHDYTNEWQRFKATHLPTFVEWGVLRRPKMYRSQIVIRVCPHLEVPDNRKHFEFALWED